jgi:hypothetical protein
MLGIVPFVVFKNTKRRTQYMNKEYIFMSKRIGTTTYKVKVYFNNNSAETMEDKFLRIITNHPLANDGRCDIINVSQMSRTA